MAIYMKFGSKVKGQVTTEGYKDMIHIHSFQWGVGRGFHSGAAGTGREASHPNIAEITLTKDWDKSSSGLLQDALAGKMDTPVEIYFTTTTATKTDTFLKLEMEKVGLAGMHMNSSGDKPTESLSLNFTKITVTPTPLDAAGKPVKGDVVGYDLLAMKTI
jgi:type VI secretion system secreted protein Hcp